MLSGCALVGNIAIEILVIMEDTSGRSRDFGRESLYVVPGKIPIAVIVHGMRLPFDERYDLQIETGVARRGVALTVFYTYRALRPENVYNGPATPQPRRPQERATPFEVERLVAWLRAREPRLTPGWEAAHYASKQRSR
jgi:hypothetical protein